MKNRSKNKKFLIFLGLSLIFSIFLIYFLDVKLVIMIFFSLNLLCAYILYKEKIGQELIIAFLFALFVSSYFKYEYTSYNLLLGRINFFPLIGWTFGLVLIREIYEKIKIEHRFFAISILYITLLLFLEYVGYYVLNIRLNSNFPSLLGLGIMHAPIGMKFFYILAGPIYILITDYLKVK